MIRTLILLAALPSPVLAAFERPVPQAQTGEAELWYAGATLLLILALGAVQWLVARR